MCGGVEKGRRVLRSGPCHFPRSATRRKKNMFSLEKEPPKKGKGRIGGRGEKEDGLAAISFLTWGQMHPSRKEGKKKKKTHPQ